MSSSSERRFRTASWMGLALCALRLAASARGRSSWKASPLRTAMGRHLARKSTKPATAIKFNTSSTLTLLSEAIKHARPALAPDPRPLGLRRGAGQPRAVRASHSGRPGAPSGSPGAAARMLGQRRRPGGRGARGGGGGGGRGARCAEVLPEPPAQFPARGPAGAPALGEGPGPGSVRAPMARGGRGRVEPRAGAGLRGRRAQGPPPVRGERGRHPRPQAAAVFSPGPAPRGGRLCSAHRLAPSRPAEGKPAPGARILAPPQSRSSLGYSQSGGSTRGRAQGQSATSSPPLAPGPPTRHQAHQRARRRGRPDAFPAPTRAASLRGLPGTPAWLRAGGRAARRPEGGVGPRKSRRPRGQVGGNLSKRKRKKSKAKQRMKNQE
uniref:Collagen alpha-1(I) chain-like n=1 Tax=Canis lupus familiaris TaxID=9615 RepID=A0A8I3MCU4_CANLF